MTYVVVLLPAPRRHAQLHVLDRINPTLALFYPARLELACGEIIEPSPGRRGVFGGIQSPHRLVRLS